MTNLDSNRDKSRTDSGEPQRHKMPLWVKGFLIAAAVIVVAFVVMHLGGGMAMNHTP